MSVHNSPTGPGPNKVTNETPDGPANAGLRQRNRQKTSNLNEPVAHTIRRRSSFFSDTFSDTHRSFRSSTDDLLMPRVKTLRASLEDEDDSNDGTVTSHWHSLPLGLALLPALAGVFFKNGSAVITDVTLLGLAAIFLNWSLRLPWEWYHAAQSSAPYLAEHSPILPLGDEEADEIEEENPEINEAGKSGPEDERQSVERELRIHEVSALLACFVFPVIGAWLLHAIRDQLSRPSEGLVSNYNLTIFLLVAELRPLSHLMKMVQRRTLFLQKRASSMTFQDEDNHEKQAIVDLGSRIEELEAHVADTVAKSTSVSTILPESLSAITSKASSQAAAELRRVMQPELDALNRAMRRYEKRMTITAIQVEARLQDLETRLQDVVVLAAAAQRNADDQPRRFLVTLTNWLCAIVVIPTQFAIEIVKLPGKFVQAISNRTKRALKISPSSHARQQSKVPNKHSVPRPRPLPKKVKNPS